jgi:hypothetical protein
MPGPERRAFSVGGPQALTTAYVAIQCNQDLALDKRSLDVPGSCRLEIAEFQLSAIAGGATTVTSFWARDAAGDYPLTPAATTTIQTGLTTATKGSAVTLFESLPSFVRLEGDTAGSLYAIVKLNAGTATLDYANLIWSQDV